MTTDMRCSALRSEGDVSVLNLAAIRGNEGLSAAQLTVDNALVDNLFTLGHAYRIRVEDLGEVRPEERL